MINISTKRAQTFNFTSGHQSKKKKLIGNYQVQLLLAPPPSPLLKQRVQLTWPEVLWITPEFLVKVHGVNIWHHRSTFWNVVPSWKERRDAKILGRTLWRKKKRENWKMIQYINQAALQIRYLISFILKYLNVEELLLAYEIKLRKKFSFLNMHNYAS